MASVVVSVFIGVVAAGEPPTLHTRAEESAFRATALHAEVVSLLDRLAAASPLARRASLGTTGEGREIPLLIIADPPVATPAEARAQVERDGKLVVLAIANIHAGEVEGKESLPMLARQILGLQAADEDDLRPLLKHLVIALAPIYNADGNERIDPGHRPGQNGPEQGVGIRENGLPPKGLDLNRDFVKLEAPETRGLVRFLVEWDPHVFIDCHTTNGSLHRFVITYAGPKMPAGDAELNRFSRDEFFPALRRRFERPGRWKAFWYGSFEGAFGEGKRGVNEHSRWETFPAEARYGTNYVGLRNRISVLSEAYAYAPFKDRVLATRDFVRSVLELASERREEIRRVLSEADARATACGNAVADPDDHVAIRTKAAKWDEPATILGYEEEERDGRIQSTGREREYSVELWDRFEVVQSVPRPWAYLIAHAEGAEAIVENLRRHGIEIEELPGGLEADVVALEVGDVTQATRLFQGHALARVDVLERPRTALLGHGSWLVRTGQPLGSLVCYLLEPACEDGLTAWNFCDRWLRPGVELPIYRRMSPLPERP